MWMGLLAGSLVDKCPVQYYVVSSLFDDLWLVDFHEYLAQICGFAMQMKMVWHLTKIFGWCCNVKLVVWRFMTVWKIFVLEIDQYVGRKWRLLIFKPKLSTFAHYFNQALCTSVSEADKPHSWRITITELLVFATLFVVAVTQDRFLCQKPPGQKSLQMTRVCSAYV